MVEDMTEEELAEDINAPIDVVNQPCTAKQRLYDRMAGIDIETKLMWPA